MPAAAAAVASGGAEPASSSAGLRATNTIISSLTSSPGSRSSADVSSSELLDELPAGQLVDERVGGAPGSRPETPAEAAARAHGHLLPSGWACQYDPSTDQWNFVDVSGTEEPRLIEGLATGQLPTRPKTMPSGRQDRGINVRTPTRDHTVQTSRRPSLKLFECKFGYHFPTSPTSSMISELAKQVQKSTSAGRPPQPAAIKGRQIGYGKHKLLIPSDEEEQARRLRDMFPTAPEPIIEQMIRIYHGREGLIKAALISLGYKRSSEYSVQQKSAQSPIMLMMSKPSSKKLFDKLAGYFPDKDESLIKSLMYAHKEVEHEIISALVEFGQERSADRRQARAQAELAQRADRNGAIMKLRYLKFLYPTCEEIEIYHLLNCNDLNAQVVMELVEKRGHKRVDIEEVMRTRKSQAQQMRAQQAAHAAQDKAKTSSATDLVKAHVQRPKPTVSEARVASLKSNIKNIMQFEQLDDQLISCALEAADFNEPLARRFLQEREPVDDELFMQRYEISRESEPDVLAVPCKATQKGDSHFMSIITNECIYIPREVAECQNALALLKVDASTFTQDDFAPAKFTHRLGPKLGLATGALHKRQPANLRSRHDSGPRANLRTGTKYEEVCAGLERPKPNSKAMGRKRELVQGRNLLLNRGHNVNLLRRTHPLFVAEPGVGA